MENQHRKIKGYRELSATEIDLMNRIKEKEQETLRLLKELKEAREGAYQTGSLSREQRSESARCAAIATTNLQQGFMWAVRAVALPGVE